MSKKELPVRLNNEGFIKYFARVIAKFPNAGLNQCRQWAQGTTRIRVSRHTPHQGAGEIVRRKAQIALGTLRTN